MQLRIDFRSGRPVYLQVVDQIKAAAASGTLRPGEALPGIGSLAGELRVNRNAIAKAYAELEGLGLIELQPGGTYLLQGDRRRTRKEAPPKPLAADIGAAMVQTPVLLHKVLTFFLLLIPLGALVLPFAMRGPAAAALGVAVAAAAFLPLRWLAGKTAHRLVFAKRFELPRALRIIKAEAPAQPDLRSFLERVAQRSEALLGARLELIQDRAQVAAFLQSLPALRSTRTPVAFGADVLMPVFSGDEVHGLLRLAPKSTGVEHAAEDLQFLAAVSEQVAAAASHFRMRHDRQESEYALEIQQGLLPREVPQIAGFTIAGSWQPARTVGGDYYDVFQLTATELALVVADVSGKGVPAALLMANLQATVKAYATLECSPEDLCGKVNRAICRSVKPGKFITFFYAVLDAGQRRLTYSNAGHNAPMLVRRDGQCLRLESGGALLGVFPGESYKSAAVDLQAGDRLVLFTDGITEAADSNGEEFGEERLLALLRENPVAGATELRDAIMQSVTQFCWEDFADDATLLTLVVE